MHHHSYSSSPVLPSRNLIYKSTIMGHTFCSPPDRPPEATPTTSPNRSSPSQKLEKRKARVSGYVQSKPGPPQQAQGKKDSDSFYFEDFLKSKKCAAVEEYWDSKHLNSVCDLVKGDPPKEADSSQQRRKKALHRLSLTTGNLSSTRHLKQMLLLRRSSSTSTSSSSSQHRLKHAVALQTMPEGKRFFKIAANAMSSYGRGDPSEYYGQGYNQVKVDPGETFRCGNPSVYQVNECQEIGFSNGKKGDKSHTPSKTENSMVDQSRLEMPKESHRLLLPPISSLDNNEPYCFDIAEEYLRQSANNHDRTGTQDTTRLDAAMARSAQRPSGQEPEDPSAGNTGAMVFPRHDSNSNTTERQRDPKRTFIPLDPSPRKRQTHRSPIRMMKSPSTNSSKALNPGSTTTSPRSLQIKSQPYSPKTPRSLSEKARRSTQPSPRAYNWPQASPVHSNSESVAEDGQSEASVGMAQSAEVVRPCFYSAGSHKLPRPGPAPTGALPSLPEGYDSKTSIVLLPSIDPETASAALSPQQSPAHVPAMSSSKDHSCRPSESAVTDDAEKLVKPRPKSQAKQQTSQSYSAGNSQTSNFDGPRDNRWLAQIHGQPQGLSQQDWREERARSRKELKMAHLDRFRARHNPGDPEESSLIACAPIDTIGHGAQTSKMRESYSSPALSGSRQPRVYKSTGQAAIVNDDSTRSSSALSPILVVAEQAPSSIVQYPAQSSKDLLKGKKTRKKHHTQKSIYSSRTAASPDQDNVPFPSSDDETAYHSCRNGTLRVSSCQRSHAQTSGTHQSSFSRLQELEARISDLEKKNAMLLSAFIAVINTSAGFSTRCDRSSVFSEQTLSGTSGQRSSGQTSSGQSGHMSGGPDVVGDKCATESVLMQEAEAGRV